MEKQIEKMAIDLCPLYEEYGSCKKCDEEFAIDDEPCLYKCMAKLCIEKGYCKTSEIVNEFFADVEEILRRHDMLAERDKSEYGEMIVMEIGFAIAELKKKYTEGTE